MSSDISSISSEEPPNSSRQLEESLGYRPTGTRNYLFSKYHRTTRYRSILFKGAYPLHEASKYVKQFYDDYYTLGNDQEVYYMSVILDTRNVRGETEVINLIKLEPSHKISERHNNIRGTIKKMMYIFTNIYDSYIKKNQKEYSKDYRTDVTFKKFKDSKNLFLEDKKSIKDEFKFKDSDDEQVVNTC
tara:strand:+ start:9967 stop:10530 length:564 start_codon:yes stop_codon:yes gene_type:complete